MVDFTPVRQSVAIRVLVVAVGKVIAELVHVEEAVAIGVDGRSLVTAQGRSWATKCDETILEFMEKGPRLYKLPALTVLSTSANG